MHCDQGFPVFLLYDYASQRLKSFGFAAFANITSSSWEQPPIKYLSVSTQSHCLTETKGVSNILSLSHFLQKNIEDTWENELPKGKLVTDLRRLKRA